MSGDMTYPGGWLRGEKRLQGLDKQGMMRLANESSSGRGIVRDLNEYDVYVPELEQGLFASAGWQLLSL